MKHILLVLILALSFTAHAENMADQDLENPWLETNDDNNYIGLCATHERHADKLTQVTKVVQKYIYSSKLTETQLQKLIQKFDAKTWKQVATDSDAYEILGNVTIEEILKDYFDDITIEVVKNRARPNLTLYRFNIGVGGGNGMYLTYAVAKNGLKLVSKTFDGDVYFCDSAVWLKY